MKKTELILKNNELLLKGVDLKEYYNIKTYKKNKYNPILKKNEELDYFIFNGKEGLYSSDIWTWKDKIILKMSCPEFK